MGVAKGTFLGIIAVLSTFVGYTFEIASVHLAEALGITISPMLDFFLGSFLGVLGGDLITGLGRTGPWAGILKGLMAAGLGIVGLILTPYPFWGFVVCTFLGAFLGDLLGL